MLELYNTIRQYLETNPMLVAGIGTAITASILYAVKATPMMIWRNIKKFATVEFTVRSQAANYQQYLKVISKNKSFLTRNFTEEDGKIDNGYGISYSYYGKRFCVIDRRIMEKNGGYNVEELLTVTFITRNKKILEKFINEVNEEKDKETINLFKSDGGYFGCYEIWKRSLDSIYIEDHIKNTIVNRIEWFINNKEWYLKRGIPYKLSMLLYGEPGTGKTSLIRAIASHFNRDMYYINKLELLREYHPSKPINFVLLEDVDRIINADSKKIENKKLKVAKSIERTFGNSKKAKIKNEETGQFESLQNFFENMEDEDGDGKTNYSSGINFHTLLNSLDGLELKEGSIFIFTANNISELDPAFLRDGRMDMKVEIPKMSDQIIKRMILSFYELENHESLDQIEFEPKTGAEIQEMLSQSFSIEEAINKIPKKENQKCVQ